MAEIIDLEGQVEDTGIDFDIIQDIIEGNQDDNDNIIDIVENTGGGGGGGIVPGAVALDVHDHFNQQRGGGVLNPSALTVQGTIVPPGVTLTKTTDKLSVFAATTSAELAGVISDETGSGVLVFGTSPTLTTPKIAKVVAPSDSTTAIQLTKADGTTAVITLDTTNSRLGVNVTPAATLDLLAPTGVAAVVQIKHQTDTQYSQFLAYENSTLLGAISFVGTNFATASRRKFLEIVSVPSGGGITLGTAGAIRTTIDGNGNLVHGTAALATTATDGFWYIPTCAGTPTGTPTAYTGRVPIIFDTTNSKLYIYNGGWLGGTVPGIWV